MRKLLFSLLLLTFTFVAVQAQDDHRRAEKIRNEYRQQALRQRLAAKDLVGKYRRLQTDDFRNQRFRQHRQLQTERQRLYMLYRKGKLS